MKPTASSHGGLITYVDNSFEVTVIKKIDFSTVWEGLFLELKHGSLKNKFVIGNIYKPPPPPPRDNNNANNIYTFTTEIKPILQELSTANTEVLICGDYNINLLKLAGESHLADFFDMILAHSFYPKIILPTRVNNSSGATLIDNIFVSYCPI